MVRKETRIPDEEHTLLKNILDYCQLRHVLANHQRPCRTVDGWRTAIEGDEGFFDLTILGPGGAILAELKRRRGAETTAKQLEWLAMGQRAAQVVGPRLIVARWTFNDFPDPICGHIDLIAKPPAPVRPGQIVISGEPVHPGGPLPPLPRSLPPEWLQDLRDRRRRS